MCGPTFIKCTRSFESNKLEGTMYRCPKGYSYWKVSRRCEKTEKLGSCKLAKDGLYNRIPVEWINLGKSRSLKF